MYRFDEMETNQWDYIQRYIELAGINSMWEVSGCKVAAGSEGEGKSDAGTFCFGCAGETCTFNNA